jgi:hypothetical protein
MDFELGNQYLIYIAILLCLNIILFYLFYKLYSKTNDNSDKLEKLDKLLAEIFINKEKQSTKTKRAKIAAEEKKEVPDTVTENDIDIVTDNVNENVDD